MPSQGSGNEDQDDISTSQTPSLLQEPTNTRRLSHDGQGGERSNEDNGWSKKVGAALQLNRKSITRLLKGAIPPTIAIALYQASDVASRFAANGYLAAVVSVLGSCLMPRARFLQHIAVSMFGTLIAFCMGLLAAYCSVKARQHTTQPGGDPTGYNASASTVCAIFLFLNVWLSNTFRAFRPQFTVSVTLYTIFSEISIISACRYYTVTSAITDEFRMLEIFFTGYALATGVSLFLFPENCRDIAFSDFRSYMSGLEKIMDAEMVYLRDMEKSSIKQSDLEMRENGVLMRRTHSALRPRLAKTWTRIDEKSLAASVASAMKAVGDIHGKMHENLPFAQMEIAWGRMDAKDLRIFARKLRAIQLPVNGLGTLTAIFEKLSQWREDYAEGDPDEIPWLRRPSVATSTSSASGPGRKDWAVIFQILQPSTQRVLDEMKEAFKHVSLVLQGADTSLFAHMRRHVENLDLETKAEAPKPGQPGFAEALEKRIEEFHATRGGTLRRWAKAQGLNLADRRDDHSAPQDRERELIFILLYIQNVWHSILDAVLELVKFTDGKLCENSKSRNHLVVPGRRKLYKWWTGMFLDSQQSNADSSETQNSESNVHSVSESFTIDHNAPHHPEHLPPKNAWQRAGERLRKAGMFFASKQSEFGCRVAIAVSNVAILGYLRQTQQFFFEQKIVWAMIIIAFCMAPTSGSSIFNLFFRVVGTAVAVVAAIANWYIVDGHTAGVMVFLYIFNCVEYYLIGRFPYYTGIFIVTIQTRNIITGYETQVNKLGVSKFVSLSGQAYYPVYTLGLHRLAAVSAGCFVAFFWTIFPYPVTARSTLRRKLGQCLFLMANYYTAMHATRDMWMAGHMGDMNDKNSPGRKLETSRQKIYAKLLVLLTSLRTHSNFTKYEPSIGGEFPKQIYDEIIREIESILNYMALVSYAAQSIHTDSTEWLRDLATYLHSKDTTAHTLTSLISLLVASIINAQPLPPFLVVPKPYHLAAHIRNHDMKVLHLEHVDEPGYSAFATMEVASMLIGDGIGRLVEYVRELVGEIRYASSLYVHPDISASNGKERKVE